MKYSLLVFGFAHLISTAKAQPENLKGAVGYLGRKNNSTELISFRTATKDYSINLSKVSPEVKAQLLSEDGSQKIIDLKIPKKAILSTSELGVRPDCGELPLNYDSIKKLAEREDITGQTDFINALPAGTLQDFTFAYKSESAQGIGVSKEFPGVVRSSSDGKLVVRYTCDETKPTYGKVEVLTFDDQTKKYKMAQFDFQA